MSLAFPAPPADKSELEGDGPLTPRFDEHGLVTAVVVDHADSAVLMLAHLTIETGVAHFYSRSRAAIWKKGETSGNLQQVLELRVDCDQDAVLLKVRVDGHAASCHTGRRSCFYRRVELKDGAATVVRDAAAPLFDPDEIYGR
jgi:phosphoribosyl-AMP cyclohydrolase